MCETQKFKVGDRIIEGFSVGYIQRIGDKTATTSFDKAGNFTMSKRVELHRLRLATEERLVVIKEFEAFDKEDQAYRRMKNQKYAEFRKRLGWTW